MGRVSSYFTGISRRKEPRPAADRAGPNNPINPPKDDTDNRKRVHNNERQFGHMAATVQLK